MKHLRTPARPRSTMRSALVRAVAALLGAGALLTVAPSAAQAGSNVCPYRNFCIWEHINYDGGRYHWEGSDSNLHNDYFVGTRTITADKGSAVRNNGSPGGLDDVRAFSNLGFGGSSICFRQGVSYPDLRRYSTGTGHSWNDNIASYKWVASC